MPKTDGKTQTNWKLNTPDLDAMKIEAKERGFDTVVAYQNFLMRERRLAREARLAEASA